MSDRWRHHGRAMPIHEGRVDMATLGRIEMVAAAVAVVAGRHRRAMRLHRWILLMIMAVCETCAQSFQHGRNSERANERVESRGSQGSRYNSQSRRQDAPNSLHLRLRLDDFNLLSSHCKSRARNVDSLFDLDLIIDLQEISQRRRRR